MADNKAKTNSGFNVFTFIKEESLGGFILIGVTIVALIWANSSYYEFYDYLWHKMKMGFSIGNFELNNSLQHWINDGLMAIFFFMIGLEIKREVLAGELTSFKKASLPLAAAIGGMLVPAVFYVIVNGGNPDFQSGWGIPMATDIAFALGLMYMLGDKVNVNLKIFLTALAIADDLGAILVIAIFYTDSINLTELIHAAVTLGFLYGANRLGVRSATFYAVVGLIGVWLSFLFSGVHATIAGVLIAFTIPVRPRISETTFIEKLPALLSSFKKEGANDSTLLTQNQSHLIINIDKLTRDAHTPLQKLEHSLHPIAAYLILPLFALSNAGIRVEGNFIDLLLHPVAIGVILGLVLGKFIGISLFAKLIVWLKLASLPEGVSWRQIYGMAFLAGIGFTMSIFISELGFDDPALILTAKAGVLIASFIAAVIGMLILSIGKK